MKSGVNALLEPPVGGPRRAVAERCAGVRALASEVVPAATLRRGGRRAEVLLAARASGAWASLGASVERAAALVEREVTFDLYRFLEDGERPAQAAEGEDTVTFPPRPDRRGPARRGVGHRAQQGRGARGGRRPLAGRHAGARGPVGPGGVRGRFIARPSGADGGNGLRRGVDRALAGRPVTSSTTATRHPRLGPRRARGGGVDLRPDDRDAGAFRPPADAVAGEVKANDYCHVGVSTSRFQGTSTRRRAASSRRWSTSTRGVHRASRGCRRR